MSTSYNFRKSALTKPQIFQVADTALEIHYDESLKTPPQVIPYEKITQIQMAYNASMRGMPETYFTTLKLKSGHKIELKNLHFLSFGQFEDRRQQYAEFIRALHNKLSEYNHITFKCGVGHALYFFSFFLIAICALGFFGGFVMMAYGLLIKGALLTLVSSFLGNKLRKYISVNKPSKYSPQNLPSHLVPN